LRIWVDLTASAHPIVLRPIVERLRAQGHDVDVTARDYAQTIELAQRMGLEVVELGRHGGASRSAKLRALVSRTRQMRRFGKGKGYELAIAHGSNDLALAARALHIPAVNTFDYEWATVQHNIGCRLARRVLVPDAIPPERLERYGVKGDKLVRYPGLKEEYYLWDFAADPSALTALGVDTGRVVVIVRPPPDVSLYHRKSNPLFPQVLQHLGTDDGVHAVVLPRTDAQRTYVRGLDLPSVIVPDGAVDGQSLVALADLVVSAGGSMNREAVALGTPVYTTYGGRLGGVDEELIRESRLRPLTDPRAIELVKRTPGGGGERRDPQFLVDRMLEAAAG
jgi:predicted glycosyltransferase